MHQMGHAGLSELMPELAMPDNETIESKENHVDVGVQTIDDDPKAAVNAPDLKVCCSVWPVVLLNIIDHPRRKLFC